MQGPAIGGGAGLLCACDIAIASQAAVFATSEVRLGLIPSVIAPYVVRTVGERQARRLFLTGERIDASTAASIGLVHQVVPADDLDQCVQECLNMLLAGAPGARREAKSLLEAVAGARASDALAEDTATRIAQRRAHPEAAEGLSAFLGKRAARWDVSAMSVNLPRKLLIANRGEIACRITRTCRRLGVAAPGSGYVRELFYARGDQVPEGKQLFHFEPSCERPTQ